MKIKYFTKFQKCPSYLLGSQLNEWAFSQEAAVAIYFRTKYLNESLNIFIFN